MYIRRQVYIATSVFDCGCSLLISVYIYTLEWLREIFVIHTPLDSCVDRYMVAADGVTDKNGFSYISDEIESDEVRKCTHVYTHALSIIATQLYIIVWKSNWRGVSLSGLKYVCSSAKFIAIPSESKNYNDKPQTLAVRIIALSLTHSNVNWTMCI